MEKIRNAIKKLRRFWHFLRKDERLSGMQAIGCLMRLMACYIFSREEFGDVISYRLIGLKHPEIYETMFTRKDNAALLPLVNDAAALPALRKKHSLLETLGNVGRRYFYVPTHTETELESFLKEGGTQRYILKPDSGAISRGILFLYTDGVTCQLEFASGKRTKIDAQRLYDKLKKSDMLIEEYITQHDDISAVFPGCVNTLCLYTVRLPNGHTEIGGFPNVQFGCGESRYTNTGSDISIGVHDNGKLFSYGFKKTDGLLDPQKVYQHPDSGIVFDGFQIPYWRDAVQLVLKCAERIPQLTYIKWDVAITPTGPVIIEGNGMPAGYDHGQTYSLDARQIGVKKELSRYYEALAFSKTLMPERVERITEELTNLDNRCSPGECDTVVVLGSAGAVQCIETAFQTFGNKEDIRYILCAGSGLICTDPQERDGKMLTEAEYMKQYLLDRGVSEDDISVESLSQHTTEDLRNAAKILRKIGSERVAVVSSWLHSRRVQNLLPELQHLGLSPQQICVIPAYGVDVRPDNWSNSVDGICEVYRECKSI